MTGRPRDEHLIERVATLTAEGRSASQIADQLGILPRQVVRCRAYARARTPEQAPATDHLITSPDDWMSFALCRAEDPELFYPTAKGPVPASTRAICYRCQVRDQCLERALELEQGLPRHARFGVWAATTPNERYRLDTAARHAGRTAVA
jgi:WhiB family redox-sensing transcriptional regulator